MREWVGQVIVSIAQRAKCPLVMEKSQARLLALSHICIVDLNYSASYYSFSVKKVVTDFKRSEWEYSARPIRRRPFGAKPGSARPIRRGRFGAKPDSARSPFGAAFFAKMMICEIIK